MESPPRLMPPEVACCSPGAHQLGSDGAKLSSGVGRPCDKDNSARRGAESRSNPGCKPRAAWDLLGQCSRQPFQVRSTLLVLAPSWLLCNYHAPGFAGEQHQLCVREVYHDERGRKGGCKNNQVLCLGASERARIEQSRGERSSEKRGENASGEENQSISLCGALMQGGASMEVKRAGWVKRRWCAQRKGGAFQAPCQQLAAVPALGWPSAAMVGCFTHVKQCNARAPQWRICERLLRLLRLTTRTCAGRAWGRWE